MKNLILTHGAAAGVAIVAAMILSFSLAGLEDVGALEWMGYLVMLVALSLIFLGIKSHRDRDLGGVIRFSRGLLLGLGITGLASVIYVIGWEVYLSVTDYAFIEEYTQSVIAAKQASGATPEALQTEIESMAALKAQYASPFFRVPMTFLEIFPVGVLISLISAGILRNSKVLPAAVG